MFVKYNYLENLHKYNMLILTYIDNKMWQNLKVVSTLAME